MNLFNKENQILLREMIRTDFKLRYQGSLIGHLWSILKPMLLFTIMYLGFIRFLRIDDGTPHAAVGVLFVLRAITPRQTGTRATPTCAVPSTF